MMQLSKGILIALEGIDGSGKTAATVGLVDILAEKGIDAILSGEGFATPYAKLTMVLHKSDENADTDDTTKALLINAIRRDVMMKVTQPALAENKVVIYDRFYLSTKAYQNKSDALRTMHDISVDGIMPDLTIILDLPLDLARQRLLVSRKDVPLDHLERVPVSEMEKRHEIMLDWYYKNESRAVMISAIGSKEEVKERVINAIECFIEKYVVSRH